MVADNHDKVDDKDDGWKRPNSQFFRSRPARRMIAACGSQICGSRSAECSISLRCFSVLLAPMIFCSIPCISSVPARPLPRQRRLKLITAARQASGGGRAAVRFVFVTSSAACSEV